MSKQQGRPRLDETTKLSRERVRQIQKRALGKARRRLLALGYRAEDFFEVFKKQRG